MKHRTTDNEFIESLRDQQVEDELALFNMSNYKRYETISKDNSGLCIGAGSSANDNGSDYAQVHPSRDEYA